MMSFGASMGAGSASASWDAPRFISGEVPSYGVLSEIYAMAVLLDGVEYVGLVRSDGLIYLEHFNRSIVKLVESRKALRTLDLLNKININNKIVCIENIASDNDALFALSHNGHILLVRGDRRIVCTLSEIAKQSLQALKRLHCPYCGADLTLLVSRCQNCRKVIPYALVTCPYCGADLSQKPCPVCGALVELKTHIPLLPRAARPAASRSLEEEEPPATESRSRYSTGPASGAPEEQRAPTAQQSITLRKVSVKPPETEPQGREGTEKTERARRKELQASTRTLYLVYIALIVIYISTALLFNVNLLAATIMGIPLFAALAATLLPQQSGTKTRKKKK